MRYPRRKNFTKVFIAVTIVSAIIFGASSYFLNQSDDLVVAKINGQKIFKSEVEAKLNTVFEGQMQEVKMPKIEALPKEVLEILVKEIYLDKELAKEATKSKVTKTPEVKAKIEAAKDKILRQTYLDSIIKKEITEQKISDKYAELSNDLVDKKEYLISHIVTKTKEEADKLSRELKTRKGAKFAELAKRHSIDTESAQHGGELGFILEDNMIKEISEVAAKLKPNEISDPTQTKYGWHIVKISEVREAKPLPFESVKGNVYSQLVQEKINEINSRITKDAKIEILITSQEVKNSEEKSVDQTTPSSESTTPSENTLENNTPEETQGENIQKENTQLENAPTSEVKSENIEEKNSEQKVDAKKSHKNSKNKN